MCCLLKGPLCPGAVRSFSELTEALEYPVHGAHIRLEFGKPDVEDRDGFGRLLACAFIENQKVIAGLVRQGWSGFYSKYGSRRLAYDFEAAEKEAMADG
jgi:endonuclease YncB( thermonuclease family)